MRVNREINTLFRPPWKTRALLRQTYLVAEVTCATTLNLSSLPISYGVWLNLNHLYVIVGVIMSNFEVMSAFLGIVG